MGMLVKVLALGEKWEYRGVIFDRRLTGEGVERWEGATVSALAGISA